METCVRREIKEEFGLEKLDIKRLSMEQDVFGETGKRLCPYLILSYEGKIPHKVLDKGNYLFWERLDHQLRHPLDSTRKMARAVIEYLSNQK